MYYPTLNYRPGTECHQKLLKHFGRESIASPDPPYPIDRARLGRLVFSDTERLKELNAIVWPEIEARVRERLFQLESIPMQAQSPESSPLSRPVVVLDAAVLLQAKWDRMCDEVKKTITRFRVYCNSFVECPNGGRTPTNRFYLTL